jgi:hypothetical protein
MQQHEWYCLQNRAVFQFRELRLRSVAPAGAGFRPRPVPEKPSLFVYEDIVPEEDVDD